MLVGRALAENVICASTVMTKKRTEARLTNSARRLDDNRGPQKPLAASGFILHLEALVWSKILLRSVARRRVITTDK